MGTSVAAVPGEGSGPEAIDATLLVLNQLDLDITWIHPPVGDGALATHGARFPAKSRDQIDRADATLFGAT